MGACLHTPQFRTTDQRAAFVSHDWRRFAVSDPDYPLTLMSVRSEGQFNTIIYEEGDSYRGTHSRWVLLMGGADRKRLGLALGDEVTLCSRHGEMRALKRCDFDLPAGNLMAYYPEANVLIGRDVDPRSHTPAFKSVSVAVEQSR